MPKVTVRPVRSENWADFAALFQARGAPHYCWCTVYRLSSKPYSRGSQRKTAMRRIVSSGTPIGLLAYDGETPIGWCSIAPRETYTRLERSRKMPRVTPPDTPTWTVLCFFVTRPYRKKGLSALLLDGAIAYARSKGAKIIEAYPFDTAGTSATHRGRSAVFRQAGFRRNGERWYLALNSA